MSSDYEDQDHRYFAELDVFEQEELVRQVAIDLTLMEKLIPGQKPSEQPLIFIPGGVVSAVIFYAIYSDGSLFPLRGGEIMVLFISVSLIFISYILRNQSFRSWIEVERKHVEEIKQELKEQGLLEHFYAASEEAATLTVPQLLEEARQVSEGRRRYAR